MTTTTDASSLLSVQSTIYYTTEIDNTSTIKSTINLDVEQTIDGANPNIISKHNDTIEQPSDETINPDNETVNDDAYIIPIRIIINAEHAHLQQNDAINGTKQYVKYDYILLQTNDSTLHKHFDNDSPDMLQIDETFQSLPLSLNSTKTNSTRKYFINEKTGQNYESKIEHTILDEQGEIAVQFDELKAVRKKQDEEDDAMMSGINLKHEQDTIVDTAAVAPTSSDIDQKNDEHYGKILQWIHYNL